VLWTAYGVPAEEYAFFVLQPIITGLLFFLIEPVHVTQPSPQRRLPLSQGARRLVRIAAGLATLAVAAYFAFAVDDSRWLYQRLIVSYFFPFIAIQLFWGADQILENLFVNGSVVIALVVSTLYFWFADSIAIALGSWKISDTHTCGVKLFGMLPLEEATFFFVTNVLIVQGLFLWEMLFAPRAPLKDTPEKKKLRSKKKVWQCQFMASLNILGKLGGDYWRWSCGIGSIWTSRSRWLPGRGHRKEFA
jgi:lycopene cyclase domain-containing protein